MVSDRIRTQAYTAVNRMAESADTRRPEPARIPTGSNQKSPHGLRSELDARKRLKKSNSPKVSPYSSISSQSASNTTVSPGKMLREIAMISATIPSILFSGRSLRG